MRPVGLMYMAMRAISLSTIGLAHIGTLEVKWSDRFGDSIRRVTLLARNCRSAGI